MKLKKLQEKIDELEATCKIFTINDNEEKPDDTTNMALKIKSFDALVVECKEEIKEADKDQMEHVLKLLFGVNIHKESEDDIDDDLEKFINSQISNNSIDVNEKSILSLKNLISNIDNIGLTIIIDYKKCVENNKKWYIFNTLKIQKYNVLIQKLKDLKDSLEGRLEVDSKKISFFIVENFYNSYIFFSFMINLAVLEKKELLLIEIASSIERYVNIIEPSFNHRALQQKDMLYHYTIYELLELKKYIFNHLNY